MISLFDSIHSPSSPIHSFQDFSIPLLMQFIRSFPSHNFLHTRSSTPQSYPNLIKPSPAYSHLSWSSGHGSAIRASAPPPPERSTPCTNYVTPIIGGLDGADAAKLLLGFARAVLDFDGFSGCWFRCGRMLLPLRYCQLSGQNSGGLL